jgi:hypothetical protein
MINEKYIREKAQIGIDVIQKPLGAKFFLIAFVPVKIAYADGKIENGELRTPLTIEKTDQTKTLIGKVMSKTMAAIYFKEKVEELMRKTITLINKVQTAKNLSGRPIKELYAR